MVFRMECSKTESPSHLTTGFRVLSSLRINGIAQGLSLEGQIPIVGEGSSKAAKATQSGNPLKHLREALSLVDGDKDTRWVGRCTTRCLGI